MAHTSWVLRIALAILFSLASLDAFARADVTLFSPDDTRPATYLTIVHAKTSGPVITSVRPPNGTFGVPYSHTYTASAASPPTYSLTSGTLPPGLSLSASGVISGVPSAVGPFFMGAVTATNSDGSDSQTFSIAIAGAVPGAPTIGTATAGNSQASVSFTAPASNGGSPITSYVATSNPGGITATGTSSPILVTGLNNGTPYTFTVAATNSSGTGPASAASNSVTPAGPTTAPVITTPAPANGGFGVFYAHQYAATGTPAPTFALASGALPQGLSLNSNGALTGIPSAIGTFTGTVTASNSAGSATQSFSISIAATVPGAPTIGTATAGNGRATVSFAAPASTGGAVVTSYTVTASPGGITATGSGSPIVVTGLTNGTTYTFTVVAVNAVGVSAASAASNPITPSLAGDVPAPVFPMTVTTNITATTATASAQIQPRSQDAGRTVSVFVFAHAPASLFRKSLGKEVIGPAIPAEPRDDDYCVLAQVNTGGQLTAVTASTMQAYTTGVLTSQGQAVSVLNNVSTPSIAGTTFYVGYGQSATNMLATGVYQSVLSVPGPAQCTASLAVAPAPASPGDLTGLWYNAAESGWGVHFTQRSNIVFAAWYTYDSAGAPKWYVASSCALPAGVTGTNGTCNGTLYEVSGPVFFSANFNPSLVNVRTAGALQVAFANANSATMTYNANGQTRTVPITRQVFATGSTAPAVDYTDLWYNASESGWGMGIAHQYGVMFLAWYVYDNTGKPVWYVASNCTVAGSGCSGTLYRTTGPPLGPTFNPQQVQVFTAGTVSVTFSDANNGALTYTVNGVTSTKAITRQLF